VEQNDERPFARLDVVELHIADLGVAIAKLDVSVGRDPGHLLQRRIGVCLGFHRLAPFVSLLPRGKPDFLDGIPTSSSMSQA
jgi:hypothetical protein